MHTLCTLTSLIWIHVARPGLRQGLRQGQRALSLQPLDVEARRDPGRTPSAKSNSSDKLTRYRRPWRRGAVARALIYTAGERPAGRAN